LEQLNEPPEFWSDAQPGALDVPVPQARLAAYFLWGGVVLLIVTGLTVRLGAHGEAWFGSGLGRTWTGVSAFFERGTTAGSVPIWQAVNVVAYFLLGLVMLSQVRFVALRQDWQVRKTAVASELGPKWWRYSLIFVVLAAVVALLLPTGYTTGLLDLLRFVLAMVSRALYWVGATLFVLVSLPFWLVARWFMGDQAAAPQAPAMEAVRPPAPPPPGGGPAWLGIVRAAFFWLMLVGFAVYLVRSFLREHPGIRRALSSPRPIRWLLQLWKLLKARLALWQATMRARRRVRGAQVRQEEAGRGPAIVQARAPDSNRGRVLYYYLDLVRRARRAGFPRRPAQTPLVYGTTLKDELPESRAQVDLLTEAFVEARYSRHSVETEVVRRVRASWQQIKQYLGGKRENRD
jgi:hypothetical protein